MNFEKQITIGSKEYNLIGVQRGGSAIYRNGSVYLRIGADAKIAEDSALHKKMENFGFPVAKLLGEGKYQEMAYFIEESLGEDCFGRIFKRETETTGQVSDETFEKFLDISIQFAEAQLKTATDEKDWENFRKGIHLDILCQEMPDEKDKIIKKYNRIEERLKVFPFGILHGDFTPFNVYPKGIIDIEDSFRGPIGYDLGALLEIQNWFPEKSDDEFYRVYKLTENQRSKFIQSIDSIYLNQELPKVFDYLADFDFMKGIWFAVRMHHLPKLQQFRYEIIKQLIE